MNLFSLLLHATTGRDRAEGWKHAKLSGHENEGKIEDLVRNDTRFQGRLLSRLGFAGRKVLRVSGGGLGESHVQSVFRNGEPTTPKADMYLDLDDGGRLTFSIKKCLSGQVYLVTGENFIEAYEAHYAAIPDPVKRGIRLFWGGAADTAEIIDKFGTRKDYENRKRRVVADTLRAYDPRLHSEFLKWFVVNASNVTDLCFARGGAKNPSDWAQFVWYRNELGETSVDSIYRISDICKAAQDTAVRDTFFGRVNGGSTIQLPFGFVQWHSPQKTFPGSMQFHHRFESVAQIVSPDLAR